VTGGWGWGVRDSYVALHQDQSVIKVNERVKQQQVSNHKSSRRKQRRGKPTRSQIDTPRRSGLGHQESPI